MTRKRARSSIVSWVPKLQMIWWKFSKRWQISTEIKILNRAKNDKEQRIAHFENTDHTQDFERPLSRQKNQSHTRQKNQQSHRSFQCHYTQRKTPRSPILITMFSTMIEVIKIPDFTKAIMMTSSKTSTWPDPSSQSESSWIPISSHCTYSVSSNNYYVTKCSKFI